MSDLFRGIVLSTRVRRLAVILASALLYIGLQAGTVARLSLTPAQGSSARWLLCASYALISLLFYGVGAFVWLYAYANQQGVASLLFCFTVIMMTVFATLSASSVGDGLYSALGSAASALAVLVLFFLLLRFPYPFRQAGRLKHWGSGLRRGAITVLVALCSFTVLRALWVYLWHYAAPAWWSVLGLSYFLLAGVCVLWLAVSSLRRVGTLRERQQARFFLLGTQLSFVPILLLTVLPMLLHASLMVDGSISMFFLVLFPLCLAYAILRYNLLLFDVYVKKAVGTVMGCVGLAILSYSLLALSSLPATAPIAAVRSVCFLLTGVAMAPGIWFACQRFSERLFFPEARFYQRAFAQSQSRRAARVERNFDGVTEAGHLIVDILDTLQAPEVCLFLLEEETGTYVLIPSPREERTARTQEALLAQLPTPSLLSWSGAVGYIARDAPILTPLQAAPRPLFLSEIIRWQEQETAGKGQATRRTGREAKRGSLLALLRSPAGSVIGVLAVAQRGDEQSYAGPELEALVQLIALSVPGIETARQFHLAIAQQERSASELQEAYQQQRELADLKDQLIVHMSHELRTPLSEVTGYLDLLKEHGPTLAPATRELFVDKAIHGCDELLQLLATILEAARSPSHLTVPELEEVNLTALLREELEHLNPKLVRDHRMVLRAAPNQQIWGNEQYVRQILRNLLSNALKYSPPGTMVTVEVQNEGEGQLCLRVIDEGPGIALAELPQLFGKFMRLSRHQSGSIRGTGLGLYLCKQMVEAMGGKIWAESLGQVGKGTTFVVQIATHPQQANIPRTLGNSDVSSLTGL